MKLGLIAMSGVRCYNKELMDYGLTLPGFLERSKVIASLPSLGLLTLAGMTPDDIEVGYVDVPDPDSLGDGLPGDFDVVAISSFSSMIKDAYALADRYRQAGTTVLLGGLHVTLMPDEAAGHADAILIGEAEPIWGEIVADLKRGTLKPRYDARGTTFDFANSPMPRFDLLDISQYNRLTVQTQRGCPFDCEFCGASIRLNPKFRTKPIDRVMAEIHAIKDIWEHPFIEFADDNTFADKRHGLALAEALEGEGVRWFTETDISVANDPKLLDALARSGCAQILIGLESPQVNALAGVEQKGNWKQRQVDHYKEAISRIQDAGVTVNGCFVLGLDDSDASSFDAVYEFVEETGLYEVQVTLMTAFPGTPLYQRLLREGRILHDGAWELCTLFDVNFQPKHMSVSELENGFRELVGRIYDDDFIDRRRRRFLKRRNEIRQDEALLEKRA
ncbi:MAG: B12-binding domain-containing radical SAM protein [Verrucomicrobiales bacterium]